jgi:hypothetical protein
VGAEVYDGLMLNCTTSSSSLSTYVRWILLVLSEGLVSLSLGVARDKSSSAAVSRLEDDVLTVRSPRSCR